MPGVLKERGKERKKTEFASRSVRLGKGGKRSQLAWNDRGLEVGNTTTDPKRGRVYLFECPAGKKEKEAPLWKERGKPM